MRRRIWPWALAAVAVLVFGSYLTTTSYLVGQVRSEARIRSSIFGTVYAAAASPDPASPLEALLDVQQQLTALGVPIVILDAAGVPSAAANLPFEADIGTEAGQARVRKYAATLLSEHRENLATVPGTAQVFFGVPPILGWLRWVPWLQASAGLLLMLVAVVMIRAEQRAERERLYAAMARELAHQMGTPLSSLAGWLEVLQLPEPERQALTSMDRVATVMGADLERLERVSRRFELIGKPQAVEQVHVDEVVRELESYFRSRLPRAERPIQLRTRIQAGLPTVLGNHVLLAWAVENVVKNAIDALAGRGGRILIAAHRPGGGWIHLHVADDGPGIDPAVRERIFEAGVSTKQGGWGVGLALSRRIVTELHRGRISARGRERGGTVFDIMLPVSAA
ncbi:MAG: HAMP domain-containing histidine kinase [Gemmatimonadetes bacterium]|nr:HAMP domain-containing histidine kinase [Gemmatimonadota bacterium]